MKTYLYKVISEPFNILNGLTWIFVSKNGHRRFFNNALQLLPRLASTIMSDTVTLVSLSYMFQHFCLTILD